MIMPAGLGQRAPLDSRSRLADPALLRAVEAVVRRRVPGDDAADVVQAALADVLAAARVPEDDEEFRRFVFAVTRNKVFDHFRKRAREVPEEDALEPVASEPPLSARDILRWAEGKLPDAEAEHTLEWMLREGDGEKLEHIARDANVPAPRVRQRVSRLRRFLRERWAAEVLLSVLGLVVLTSGAILYYEYLHQAHDVAKHDPELRPEPLPSPVRQARELRRLALDQCELDAQDCLDRLDRARALDPAGDAAPEIVRARAAAAARITQVPTENPIPVPSTSANDSLFVNPPTHTAPRQSPKPMRQTAPSSTDSAPPQPAPSDVDSSVGLGALRQRGSIDSSGVIDLGTSSTQGKRPHKAK